MNYYLLDNPPASRQFWETRNSAMTGGVVIHTTEGVGGDDSAENTAGFIARRSDPGSYHCIVDWNSTVYLMPDSYTAFQVAADGFNSRCWGIALACKSSELDINDWATQVMFDRAGLAIVEFWRRNGIDPVLANDWIDARVKERAGLCQHGEAQPWDRSDAFVGHPQQFGLGLLLNEAIARHAGVYVPAPPPEPIPDPLPDLGWIADALNSARSQVLSLTMKNDAVKWLQALLNSNIDAGLAVDGVFGPATEAAVKQVQANLRDFFDLGDQMAVDGIVGPKTWFWLTLGM